MMRNLYYSGRHSLFCIYIVTYSFSVQKTTVAFDNGVFPRNGYSAVVIGESHIVESRT